MKHALKRIVWEAVYGLRNALNLFLNFREVSILCYHSISSVSFSTNVLPADFELHLEGLKKRGYVFVSLADVVAWVGGQRALPRRAVALTFDDGYADFASVVLPLAQKYQAPVAVFAVGDVDRSRAYLGQENSFLSPEALAELAKNPLVEVGYHSKAHPNLSKVAEGDLPKEVTPRFPARYFAYPGGGHSPAAVAALKAAGYEAAFTIRPVPVRKGMDPYLLPRSVILKGMSARDVLMRASRAAQWYRFLSQIFRP